MPPPNPPPAFQTASQELSLYAHIPASRQPQLLRILSGITGMRPKSSFHHHLIYRPKRQKTLGPGGGELYYLHVVSLVPEKGEEGFGDAYDVRKQKWTIKVEDLPEVSRKPVSSRSVLKAEVGMGDGLTFVDSLGYALSAVYITSKHRLIHNNIIITLDQILLPPPPFPPSTNPDSIYSTPFPISHLTPLDPARSWILRATIRVQSSTDVESVNTAVNELKAFKELLKGVCELDPVERLALDTRAR